MSEREDFDAWFQRRYSCSNFNGSWEATAAMGHAWNGWQERARRTVSGQDAPIAPRAEQRLMWIETGDFGSNEPPRLVVDDSPRASYGSGMIDAIEDFAPVPRADAEQRRDSDGALSKDAALTDAKNYIVEICAEYSIPRPFAVIEKIDAATAKEKKS